MTGLANIQGRAFWARSSRMTPAELAVIGDHATLTAEDGETIAQATLTDIAFDHPVGSTGRRLTFPDGTLFETTETDVIDALGKNGLFHAIHNAESISRRTILYVLGAIVGVWAVWRFALPVLVWIAVALTPQPVRQLMDQGILQSLDLTIAHQTTLPEEQQTMARTAFADLLAVLPEEDKKDTEYSLYFRHIPGIGPNAIALPGGSILITDALIRDFPDPNIVAGVLGHEIGHIAEDHGLTQLYQSLGIYVLVALIAGDTGPIVEDILLEGNVILSLSFSRKHELAADRFGIDLTERAGYDPSGLLEFFADLPDAGSSGNDWGSTHPATGDRIEAIRSLLWQRD